MTRAAHTLIALLAVVGVAGCQYPRDPDGTLDRVRGGTMVVGWTVSEPWVVDEGNPEAPSGLEPELLEAFARTLDAGVEWVEMPEGELQEALERKTIDIAIGGFTSGSELKRRVSLTRSYVSTHLEVATRDGGELPDDLEGTTVAVVAHSPGEGRLRQATKAIVEPLEDIREHAADAVAAWDYELDDLGLEPTDKELVKERHVMAVPLGENAWQIELEHFLLDRGAEIAAALREEGP